MRQLPPRTSSSSSSRFWRVFFISFIIIWIISIVGKQQWLSTTTNKNNASTSLIVTCDSRQAPTQIPVLLPNWLRMSTINEIVLVVYGKVSEVNPDISQQDTMPQVPEIAQAILDSYARQTSTTPTLKIIILTGDEINPNIAANVGVMRSSSNTRYLLKTYCDVAFNEAFLPQPLVPNVWYYSPVVPARSSVLMMEKSAFMAVGGYNAQIINVEDHIDLRLSQLDRQPISDMAINHIWLISEEETAQHLDGSNWLTPKGLGSFAADPTVLWTIQHQLANPTPPSSVISPLVSTDFTSLTPTRFSWWRGTVLYVEYLELDKQVSSRIVPTPIVSLPTLTAEMLTSTSLTVVTREFCQRHRLPVSLVSKLCPHAFAALLRRFDERHASESRFKTLTRTLWLETRGPPEKRVRAIASAMRFVRETRRVMIVIWQKDPTDCPHSFRKVYGDVGEFAIEPNLLPDNDVLAIFAKRETPDADSLLKSDFSYHDFMTAPLSMPLTDDPHKHLFVVAGDDIPSPLITSRAATRIIETLLRGRNDM